MSHDAATNLQTVGSTKSLDIIVDAQVSLFGSIAAALLDGRETVVFTTADMQLYAGRHVRVAVDGVTDTVTVSLVPEDEKVSA